MTNDEFSFSYKQELYNELTEGTRRYLKWIGDKKVWKYDRCSVSLIGVDDDKIRVVLRRKISGYSSFMKSNYSVNLMMGFISLKSHEPQKVNGNWEIRFDVEQSRDSKHRDLFDVKIYSNNESSILELFKEIKETTGYPPKDIAIFSSNVMDFDGIVPVIYQPKIDSWKNFLREVHVAKISEEKFEITLVFQDEHLRKHFILDWIYRIVRLFRYKRIVDIENFFFYKSESDYFKFPGIYSDKNSLFNDSAHFDKPEEGPVENRPVKYFYKDKNHPIVFVNTSNHALAPHDNNHDMWKWEYVPWSKDIPIVLGNKTREQVEQNQQLILRKEILNL